MQRSTFFALLVGAALIGPTDAAVAQTIWEPPPAASDGPESKDAPVARGSQDIVSTLKVGARFVALQETPLQDLQAQFGGTIGHRADAGPSLSWLCLWRPGKRQIWVLWLEDSELSAGTVAAFQWRVESPTSTVDPRCQALPAGATVDVPLRIRPGQRRTQVRAHLGPPSLDGGDSWLYLRARQIDSQGTPFDVTNGMVIGFRDGRVDSIDAWKTTSD
jgi:hypothetical protein